MRKSKLKHLDTFESFTEKLARPARNLHEAIADVLQAAEHTSAVFPPLGKAIPRLRAAFAASAQQPRARGTDPDTSHEAARRVLNMTDKRQAVLQQFMRAPFGMSDNSLVDFARLSDDANLRGQTASGLRTRRSELVSMGLIVDSGRRATLPSGRRAIVWTLKPAEDK